MPSWREGMDLLQQAHAAGCDGAEVVRDQKKAVFADKWQCPARVTEFAL